MREVLDDHEVDAARRQLHARSIGSTAMVGIGSRGRNPHDEDIADMASQGHRHASMNPVGPTRINPEALRTNH